jgi:pimeloyl-ACP methyl ester carboxylesterase
MPRRVQRGEHRIFVGEQDGAGPAIVLMHGFLDNRHLYDRLVPYLEGRQVVTFDFLGWGESEKPQNHDYTFANRREDLDAVISGLDPRTDLVASAPWLPQRPVDGQS